MKPISTRRILIVEDEPKLGRAVCDGFLADQFEAIHVLSGEEALFYLSRESFDLVILDIMLPGRSGLEVLELMRKDKRQTPVLLLTAKDQLDDKIAGFNAGADDYLVKPFAFAELLLRARAMLKRSKGESSLKITTKNLSLDLLTREVLVSGQRLDLTLREFELLEYLVRHKGEVVAREMLGNDVWKETSRSTTLDNVIDVHVARLRKKLEVCLIQPLIHTVRGVGFSFKDED